MGTRERKVESRLTVEIALQGGITRKWVSPGRDGVPDRIVFFGGRVCFVELKTQFGRLSPVQVREHKCLREAGAEVTTIFGSNGVDSFIAHMHNCSPGDIFKNLREEYR